VTGIQEGNEVDVRALPREEWLVQEQD